MLGGRVNQFFFFSGGWSKRQPDIPARNSVSVLRAIILFHYFIKKKKEIIRTKNEICRNKCGKKKIWTKRIARSRSGDGGGGGDFEN